MRYAGRTTLFVGAVLVVGSTLQVGAATAQLQDQTRVAPTNDLPNPYERVHPWGELPTGPYADRFSFIGAEEGPDGNIYLLGRCMANSCTGRSEPPVLKLDPSGALLDSWGSGMLDFPHGFDIDDDGNVWATDQRGHQAFKWSPDGELLMTIGERGTAGGPPELLSEPTDIVVAPSGDIFITEGHSFSQGANRVTKWASDGAFIMSWGSTGSAAGEFNVPHTIALDSQGRIFVGDRGNNRIQLFDQEGNFLDVWYQFSRPSGIAITDDDQIFVADSESWGTDNPGWKKGIRVGSARDGSVQYLIEDFEPTAVEHSGAEGVGVDSQGNVYGAVVRRRMLEVHRLANLSAAGEAVVLPTHIGHVARGFDQAPDGRGLVATASTEAGIAVLHANFSAGDLSDLAAMRRHAGHVAHALDPSGGGSGPGLGYGLVAAAEGVATHIELATQADGASDVLRSQTEEIAAIARSIADLAGQAAGVAEQLRQATSIRRASPLVAELRLLVYALAEGSDDLGPGVQQLEGWVYALLEAEGLPRVVR